MTHHAGSAPAHHPITTAEKLAELREKLELAKEPGGEKAAAKRDKKGIPSARARIHDLVDPGSFLEIGALAKTPGDSDALTLYFSPAGLVAIASSHSLLPRPLPSPSAGLVLSPRGHSFP